MKESQNIPKVRSARSEDFKVVFIDGGYTWLTQETGTISFFYDVVDDPITDELGNLNVKTGKRVFPVEIRMRRSFYAILAQFMLEQLKAVESLENAKSDEDDKPSKVGIIKT